MSISDKVRKSLEKIGLTSYEIRTYISLINGGELNASELSNKSGVPYSKIYEVLGTFEEKGWIGSDDSRPTNYIAKSPTTSLDTTKQNLDTEFSNNQNHFLRLHLQDNDLINWAPQSNTYLIHAIGDELIPFENAQIAYDNFIINGSESITLSLMPESYGGHQEAAPYALIAA